MNAVDLIIIGFTFVLAVWGYHQGLIVGGLSLLGFVAGALLGSRVAPLLLEQGAESPYAPLGVLAGALLVGALLAAFGELVGSQVRERMGAGTARRPRRGGAPAGGRSRCCAWIAGAAAIQTPALQQVRHDLQRSVLLGSLNETCPGPARC